ncbi:AIR carboxylase family protein, partial [Francisella tularensis subsp. holarctica]|uniref:AIR carboxylase family protein n=1 Tax=Francisella tularensis TaxID=263 RepID=UPI002381CE50
VQVVVLMGSNSAWSTLKECCDILDYLGICYECEVVSAHRTPDKMFDYSKTAKEICLKFIIAGAGGDSHLPGMVAEKTA